MKHRSSRQRHRESRRHNPTRADAYKAYRARLRAGFTNPLNPGGESSEIRPTHIDRFGCRYEMPPLKDIVKASRDGVALVVQFYRPSLRQRMRGCDACTKAHVESNIYCKANEFCTRSETRLDPQAKFKNPTPNTGGEEDFFSIVPGRFNMYKALCVDFHIIGKNDTACALKTIYNPSFHLGNRKAGVASLVFSKSKKSKPR